MKRERPLTSKQKEFLALIPRDGVILWLTKPSSRFAVFAGGELTDIGTGWGPTLESLYYRGVVNAYYGDEEIPEAHRSEWDDARRFKCEVGKP